MNEATRVIDAPSLTSSRPADDRWPIAKEDGSTAAHLLNVGADYEKRRRKAIRLVAAASYEQQSDGASWPHAYEIHHAVAAAQEEREWYRRVPLTDQDRGHVYYVLHGGGPATYREIVLRLNGVLGRRQARRALASLVSRGAVTASRVRPWTTFATVEPRDIAP